MRLRSEKPYRQTRFFASSVLGPLQMELRSMTVRILGVGVAALTLIALASAHAQQMLGADSLSNMVDTYRQNEARFKRDYVGKQFEGTLPFRSAKENLFVADRYLIGFGTGGFTSDVLHGGRQGSDEPYR